MTLVPANPIVPDFFRSIIRNPLMRVAEIEQGRSIRSKVIKLRSHYRLSPFLRRQKEHNLLVKALYSARLTSFYAPLIPLSLIENVSKDVSYLRDIPVTRKEDLLNDPLAFINTGMLEEAGRIYTASTNGSTGPCATMFYNQDAADWSAATTWFCRAHLERFFANSTLHLASNLIDNSQPLPTWKDWLRFYSTNRFNLFFSGFSRDNMEDYLNEITRYSCNIVHGQPSMLLAIASLIRSGRETPKRSFRFFESSGETLTSEARNIIEESFACKCINRYGLAEFGVVAYQLDSECTDLALMTHLIHPLPINDTSEDRLLLTSLRNHYFPLVNYDTGDELRISPDSLNLSLLPPKGRIHSIVNIDGKSISTSVIMDILNHRLKGVLDFQLNMLDFSFPVLLVSLSDDSHETVASIENALKYYASVELKVELSDCSGFVRTGTRQKFSFVVK